MLSTTSLPLLLLVLPVLVMLDAIDDIYAQCVEFDAACSGQLLVVPNKG